MSLKEDLLAFSAPGPAAVEIRGKTFYVRVMTAYDSALMQKALEKHQVEDGMETGRVLTQIICDESGRALYDIGNKAEVEALSKLAPDVSRGLFDASNSANGLKPGK